MTLFAALSFATSSQSLIVSAIIIASVSMGLQGVFISSVINKIVPSTHRAIALSIQTQMHLVFNFILLIIVSQISDKFSISAGMLLVSIVIAIATTSFFALIHKKPEPKSMKY